MYVTIHNVVTTSDLCQEIDVTLFKNYPWGEYDQEIYHGICGYIKDSHLAGKVTVFLSGKMISLGSKSIQKSIDQLNYATNLLFNEGLIKAKKIQTPQVRNIVATIYLERSIDINYLLNNLEGCEYDPQTFPAIILRRPKGTCLVYKTGKIVVSGAKTEASINHLGNEIKKTLNRAMNSGL